MEIKQEEEPQDIKTRRKIKNWGIGLIVMGIISLLLPTFLNPIWGGLIIAVGILFIVIRQPGLYIVGGAILILAGLYNILIGSMGGWTIFGILQIGLGISENVQFKKLMTQSNGYNKKNQQLIPILALIPLILIYLTLVLPIIPSPSQSTSPEQKTIPSHFITYTDEANHFSISYPSDWTPHSLSYLPTTLGEYEYILLAGPFDLNPGMNIVVGQIQSIIINHNLLVNWEIDTLRTEGFSLKSQERTIIDGRSSTLFISQDPITFQYFIQGIFIIDRTEWCITCGVSSDKYYSCKDDLEAIIRSFRYSK